MLRSNNRLDYVGKVVDIGEGLDAEKDIIKSGFATRGIFGAWYDYMAWLVSCSELDIS